jgi:hypothetical protein
MLCRKGNHRLEILPSVFMRPTGRCAAGTSRRQVRSAAHALDAPVRLVDHLGQACRGQVGQLDGLEPGPQALDRVYRSGSTLTRFRCQSRSPTWFAASCTPGPT